MNPITGIHIDPYLLAIVGGLVAFAIVWLIARLLIHYRGRYKNYLIIEKANDELLGVIIPLVIDKRLPRKSIIDTFRISIAKKYGINPDDLLPNSQISHEIINQTMVSLLLRNDQKIDLCDSAQRLETFGELEQSCSCATRENPVMNGLSLIIGVLAGAQVIITTILVSCKDPGFASDFRNFIILMVISIVLPILLILLTLIPKSLLLDPRSKDNDVKKYENDELSIKEKQAVHNNPSYTSQQAEVINGQEKAESKLTQESNIVENKDDESKETKETNDDEKLTY
jgi:hypothetical protein